MRSCLLGPPCSPSSIFADFYHSIIRSYLDERIAEFKAEINRRNLLSGKAPNPPAWSANRTGPIAPSTTSTHSHLSNPSPSVLRLQAKHVPVNSTPPPPAQSRTATSSSSCGTSVVAPPQPVQNRPPAPRQEVVAKVVNKGKGKAVDPVQDVVDSMDGVDFDQFDAGPSDYDEPAPPPRQNSNSSTGNRLNGKEVAAEVIELDDDDDDIEIIPNPAPVPPKQNVNPRPPPPPAQVAPPRNIPPPERQRQPAPALLPPPQPLPAAKLPNIVARLQPPPAANNRPASNNKDVETDPARISTAPKLQHPWSKDVAKALRQRFKLTGFRANQEEAINATLSGKDVFVLLPTGGGKSLCFQLPAVVQSGKTRGVTIVVSPLLSLISDQCNALQDKDIPVVFLNSTMPAADRAFVMTVLRANPPQACLAYVTPEQVRFFSPCCCLYV